MNNPRVELNLAWPILLALLLPTETLPASFLDGALLLVMALTLAQLGLRREQIQRWPFYPALFAVALMGRVFLLALILKLEGEPGTPLTRESFLLTFFERPIFREYPMNTLIDILFLFTITSVLGWRWEKNIRICYEWTLSRLEFYQRTLTAPTPLDLRDQARNQEWYGKERCLLSGLVAQEPLIRLEGALYLITPAALLIIQALLAQANSLDGPAFRETLWHSLSTWITLFLTLHLPTTAQSLKLRHALGLRQYER